VTLRENTERPETVAVGANIVAATEPKKALAAAKYFLKEDTVRDRPNPCGENCAGKIVDCLAQELERK